MIAVWTSPFAFAFAWFVYIAVVIVNLGNMVLVRKTRRRAMEAKDMIIQMQQRTIGHLQETTAVLQRRVNELQNPKQQTFNPVFQQSETLREILKEGQRGLAKKYHPDKPGGDARKMQQINAIVDRMVSGR